MKIDSYEVKASSQREYLYAESTMVMLASRAQQAATQEQGGQTTGAEDDQVRVSDAAKALAEKAAEHQKKLAEGFKLFEPWQISGKSSQISTDPNDLKICLLEMMLSAMSGKKVRVRGFKPVAAEAQAQPQLPAGTLMASPPAGRESVLQTEHFQYESERVSYQASGLVQTADGRSISVDINLYMSREFASYTQASIKFATPVDPLVINYGGSAASLTNQKFDFDLTMDGKMEQISFAGRGSGFLALDKNGDGIINDGGELFGPASGNGFAELRAYDQDENGWIDENDDVFSQLVVWSKDAAGNDQLFTLQDLAIGAIYLGDLETNFTLANSAGNSQGAIRTTSFFLKENGGAGTVQHVDLYL